MISPDTRVPPLAPGTLCRFGELVVRAYLRQWSGPMSSDPAKDQYEVRLADRDGKAEPGPASRLYATREQLEVIRG